MAIRVNGTTVIDDSRNLTNIGTITATSYSGDGSSLTGLTAGATFGTSYSTAGKSGGYTAHYNNSSKHRIVYLGGHGSVDYVQVSPNNSSWYTIYNTGGGTGWYEMNHTTMVVPPYHYWRFSGSSYSYFCEIF